MKINDLFTIRGWPSSTENTSPISASKLLPEREINLALGQLFKSRVSGFTEDGRVLLNIDGLTVVAESRVPLKAGSELWLEVRGTGKEILLSQAMKKGAVHEFMKNIPAARPAISGTITALATLSEKIKDGISLEKLAKLAPLFRLFSNLAMAGKPDSANLLEILLLLAKQGPADPGKAKTRSGVAKPPADLMQSSRLVEMLAGEMKSTEIAGFERLIKIIESLSQINRQPVAGEQTPFFLFPCFFAGASGWGEWMFSLEGEKNSRERTFNPCQTLRFFLDMSRLGQVHLEMTIKEQGITGVFSLEDEQKVEFMADLVATLKPRLTGLGYGPVNFKCRQAARPLLQELKETLQRQADMKSIALLDVNV